MSCYDSGFSDKRRQVYDKRSAATESLAIMKGSGPSITKPDCVSRVTSRASALASMRLLTAQRSRPLMPTYELRTPGTERQDARCGAARRLSEPAARSWGKERPAAPEHVGALGCRNGAFLCGRAGRPRVAPNVGAKLHSCTALPSLAQVISSTPLFHQPGPHPQSSFVFFPILMHRMLLASPRYRCRRRPRFACALSSAASTASRCR